MKKLIVISALLATAIYAPAATKKKSASASTTAPSGVTIPKDAVPNGDGNTYVYTDKNGKKWVYVKTPFGIIKNAYLETAATGAPVSDGGMTKAIDKGDTVRFERPGPFGTIAWEKKKSDLTDDERHIAEASSAKPQ
ncbi:MAG: hypothetical protein M3N93_09020 [Acidobacteriota bacterium]|nr:hypothetical protein [Acidobacteriota bacterium]